MGIIANMTDACSLNSKNNEINIKNKNINKLNNKDILYLFLINYLIIKIKIYIIKYV